MSSYKQLTNTPAYNFGGEMKWDTKTPSDGWVVVDGSLVAINTAPRLFEKIDYIEDLVTPTYANSTPTGVGSYSNTFNAIVFANNTFIVAGDNGLIATSPDYTNWTVRTSGTANNINTLIFANNTFVYAGNGGVLATSSDAVTWTSRTSGTTNNINSLAFANNTFVYVGNNGTLATSPNAVTWTARTSGTSNNLNSITHGGDSFVYVGNTGTLATSSNAITWTARTSGTTANLNSVIYGSNTYVYGGNDGVLATSSNAITWTARTSGTSDDINVVSFLNNRFLYGSSDGIVGISSDAITWTRPTPIFGSANKFYVGGKTVAISGSGSTDTVVSLTDLTGGLSNQPDAYDYVFVAIASSSDTNRPQGSTLNDYAQLASLYINDTYDTNLWVGFKIMTDGTLGDPSPDTSITIPASGNADDAQTVVIQVWRFNNSGVFLDTVNQVITNTLTNTVLVNPPAITTPGNNSVLLVIGAGAHIAGIQTFTAPYLDNFLTVGSNDTFDSTIGMGSLFLNGSQTYDPASWTFSAADAVTYSNASVTIGIRVETLTGIQGFAYGKGTYVACRDNGRISQVTYLSYDSVNEFKLPTITDSSIVSGINNRAYIKLA